MDSTVRFYFSFRSPYAWLAAERWQAELGALNPDVEHVPFYPTRESFPNDPTRFPAKYRYVIRDVQRLARDFGLTLMPPASLDTDWERAHASYLGVRARDPAGAARFLIQMFRARFSRSEDPADEGVIAAAAVRAEVDPVVATTAAGSAELHAEVRGNFARGQQEHGIFGAPSFVYRGELFWGQDRMRHLRDAIAADRASRIHSG